MSASDKWIPEVAVEASRLYAKLEPGTVHARRVLRLGTDSRLLIVWRTLAHHNKDNIRALFRLACCGDEVGSVVTRKELEDITTRYRTVAQQLSHLVGSDDMDPRK